MAPLILQNAHGSVSGTDHIDINPAGTRLYLSSGQVVHTSTSSQDGLITPGPSQVGDDGTRVYVAMLPDTIAVHDATTYEETRSFALPCGFTAIETLRILSGDAGLLVLGDDRLCGLTGIVPVSLTLSPPTGEYLTTQDFDLAVVIGTGDSSIADLEVKLNGDDRTDFFKNCAVPGFTPARARTLRCPNMSLPVGRHIIEITVRLSNGAELIDSAIWEIGFARE